MSDITNVDTTNTHSVSMGWSSFWSSASWLLSEDKHASTAVGFSSSLSALWWFGPNSSQSELQNYKTRHSPFINMPVVQRVKSIYIYSLKAKWGGSESKQMMDTFTDKSTNVIKPFIDIKAWWYVEFPFFLVEKQSVWYDSF